MTTPASFRSTLWKPSQTPRVFADASEQKFNSTDYVRGLYPANFTAADAQDRNKGFFFSNFIVFGQERMDGPLMDVDMPATATDFALPIFIFQGRNDDVTPTPLVEKYVQAIHAPKKELVLLPGDHLAVMADPQRFLDELTRRVHPMATT
jgi:pimeloyl-ACP methyl ester carboxylesterase